MSDVFNNPSNDYVYPALSPCAGAGDDTYLEFTKEGIGIISGNKILAEIDFSALKIQVSSYSTKIKILKEGEVIYIPGLTKGLSKRQEGFTIPTSLVSTDEDLNSYFLEIDLSINYYKSFKYSYSNIDVSANYGENINIEDALNIGLGNAGISATATYDPSIFFFNGTIDGYDFNISNVKLSIIDTSENSSSPFAHGVNDASYGLVEDSSLDILYARYPNGAMQGIIMKGTYPGSTTQCPYDHWLYINHATDYVTLYESRTIDTSTYYEKVRKKLDVGMSGDSTANTISAGDYLEWITTNEYWNKFGEFYSWTTTPDSADYKNLIDGFYVYNPHAFDIKIEYMLFVYES